MKAKLRGLARVAYATLALSMAAVIALPTLIQDASAAQVTSRSIEMSDSRVSQTGASYIVSFTAQTAGLSLVMDFCQDSPIIGSTCNTTNGVTFTSPSISGSTLPVGWTTASSSGSTFKLAGTTNALAPTTAYTFTINGVNNPTGTSSTSGAAGTFYARIYTYANNSFGTYSSPSSIGSDVDYGGFALSTTTAISITATVQEQLQFCVSDASPGAGCSGTTTPTVTLGTGSPPILQTSGAGSIVYTQLTTNANSGVTVRMKATNACTNGGLSTAPPDSSGGCASIVGTGSTPAVLAGGKWGMCVAPGAGETAAVSGTYTDLINSCPTTFSATSKFGMNGANVTGTYGDIVYTTGGAVSSINNTLMFAAMAAATTPAGVYQGNEVLIATGVF